jgi:hypothetical protein
LRFLTLVDLADKLYARAIDEQEYIVAEVVFIELVDLGGDFQRDASGARYSNRAVRALFRRNPPKEGKLAPLLKRRPMQVGRNAVVYRRSIICQRQWFALVGRDRNQRHFAEAGIKGLEICQILPAVKRSQSPNCQRAEKRKVEEINVKMKDVKLLRALVHLINHQHEVRNDVAHGRI